MFLGLCLSVGPGLGSISGLSCSVASVLGILQFFFGLFFLVLSRLLPRLILMIPFALVFPRFSHFNVSLPCLLVVCHSLSFCFNSGFASFGFTATFWLHANSGVVGLLLFCVAPF